ncbi:MAG: hypothetical protein Q8O88_03720 [bacterium]|nr:hypothetical protein [bacterium]
MHFNTAVFHDKESDVNSLMELYSFDYEENLEFNLEFTQKQAIAEFNHFKKTNKDYKSVDDFMENYHCYCKNDDGDWGNMSNPDGLYDWFEIGGRWKNILYKKVSKVEMKKVQDKELKIRTKFRLSEYMRLKMLTPEAYYREKDDRGKTTIRVRDLDIKTTLVMAENWAGKRPEIGELFETLICEEGGIRETDDFMKLLEFWKARDGYITIVDYHS